VFPDASGMGLPNGVFGPPCCCWARRVVVRPLALSLSPPWRRRQVHRIVVGPFALPFWPAASSSGWLSPSCRRSALRAVVRPTVSLLCRSRRRWAHMPWLRCSRRRRLRRVVVGLFASSVDSAVSCLACSRRRWAHRAVLGLFVLMFGPPCCRRVLCVLVEATVSWLGSSRRR